MQLRNIQTKWAATIAVILVLASGCGPKFTLEEANKAYENKQYALAAEMYEAVYKDKNTLRAQKSEIAFKTAECYRNFDNYDKALKNYEKALKDENNTQAVYMKGVILQKQGNYRDAIKAFDEYLKSYPGDKAATAKKQGCEMALAWKDDCLRYRVSNFKVTNTRDNDYSPMIADKKDGILYFTSDRNPEPKKREKIYVWTGSGFSDIWTLSEQKQRRRSKSANTEKKWGKPEILNMPPNTKANDGTVAFNRRYNELYYTICNGGDNKTPACKIYVSKKLGTDWGEPEVLSFCANDSLASYGHPTVSEDGDKLYFSSNKEGGFGGHDLYVVNFVRRGRTWSDPINLGSTINTDKNEMFPYLNNDGKLYFSSNGHPGFGSLDLFITEGNGEEWSTPENLSMPMNSGADDFGITFDNNDPNHGFFTSNRDDGKGGDDIYEFYKIPPVIDVKGIVTDSTTGKPIPGCLVAITWNDTNKIEIVTDQQGSYFTELLENFDYTIRVTNDTSYYFPSRKVASISTKKLKCDEHFIEDFRLKSMIEIWELPIFYDLDKANIRPDAARVLDKFSKEVLAEYPRIVVELGSHTDCRSSYDYNMDLSRRRADSAVAYLVGKGVLKERMFAKGYGESELTNKCACEGTVIVPCSEAEHQENRRTTIKVVNFNFDPRNKTVIGGNPLNTNDGSGNLAAYKLDSAQRANEKRMQDSAGAVLAKFIADSTRIDSLSVKLQITETNGVKTVPVKVGENSEIYQFAYDPKASRTSIPVSMAEEWFNKGILNKGDFADGEKLKGPNGTKLPSNRFTLPSMFLGDYEVSRISFYILDDETTATLGKVVFRKFDEGNITEIANQLILLPKRR